MANHQRMTSALSSFTNLLHGGTQWRYPVLIPRGNLGLARPLAADLTAGSKILWASRSDKVRRCVSWQGTLPRGAVPVLAFSEVSIELLISSFSPPAAISARGNFESWPVNVEMDSGVTRNFLWPMNSNLNPSCRFVISSFSALAALYCQ